ncbi:MAG: transporter [Undibacterium sp.]|nr:transporter [Opitutaceae bacterium]
MTQYDYAVLVFYFFFMLTISWVFRHFVTNVSDYFRGGGQALWWMVGGSAFMVQFSAWTFTGAASKAYSDGWPVAVIYVGNAIGFLCNALYFAPKFRQMRVVTFVEAIRARFGRGNEQVFTWLQLPTGILQAGLWLNALGVFFAAVFGFDLTTTIVITGAVVLMVTLVSGSWAVLAGDFIQMLILMPVCLATTVLALLKVGGVGSFIDKLPRSHLDFSSVFTDQFLGMWVIAMLLKQFLNTNNMTDASRYLCVKDSRHARWAGYLGAGLFFIGIVIWFVPPMAARILHPDLAPMFPHMKNPSEASFIAIAHDVLPVGMLGLLVCGILASTVSTMDAGLNKNAGIFIKNFYQPVLRPAATDQQLLRASKFATVILGALVTFVAWRLSQLQGLTLFSLTVRFSALVTTPFAIPLLWGMLVKNTPPWSGWSTVAVGFLTSLVATYIITPEAAAQFFNTGPLTKSSTEYWEQGIATLANLVVCTAWFFGSKWFWDRSTPEYKVRVLAFFDNMNRPVDFAREEGANSDAKQSMLIGWLCISYGAFVCLLALIPNPLAGRLAFLFCGGLVGTIGAALLYTSRKDTTARLPDRP